MAFVFRHMELKKLVNVSSRDLSLCFSQDQCPSKSKDRKHKKKKLYTEERTTAPTMHRGLKVSEGGGHGKSGEGSSWKSLKKTTIA